MAGRTTFTIAHRLSTVRRADVILVLNEGRLVQQGTHEELLEMGGLYRRLHDLQHGLAAAGVSRDGQPRDEIRPPVDLFLVYADLLVAAVDSLLRDGTPDDLVSLLDAYPERMDTSAEWSLLGAILAVLRDDADEPLRLLAARISERSRRMHRFAHAARHLLGHRDVLRRISHQLREGRGPGDPLDVDLVMNEPWKQLAKVAPAAAEAVLERLPTPGVMSPQALRQRRMARAGRA
jgi:hypothetical protein